ncbi:hypothetical protein [Planktotalea sp.]|uniref:hypothetical protein n=1 Tax=Planktotalea sp. TaxID=2029877 RepID=UPI0035C85B1C
MEDWLSFEGVIVAMEWGESVYTVLPLPDDIYDTLKAQGTKRVDVELNDCPFNMALTKAPVIDSVFIYAGKNILAAAEIEPAKSSMCACARQMKTSWRSPMMSRSRCVKRV